MTLVPLRQSFYPETDETVYLPLERSVQTDMSEQYDVTLQSPMGPRRGTLQLEFSGESVRGIFSLLGFEKAVFGTRTGPSQLRLVYSLRSAVSTLQCSSVLELTEYGLSGETSMAHASWRCHGRLTGTKRQER